MHKTLLGYMDLFVHSQDPQLSPRTLVTKKNYLSLFLNYLDSSGIYNLRDFDINAVYSFIDSLDYASQTISGIQFTIREFFDILFGNNCTSTYGRKIFPIILTNKRDRILSYYEPDEVRSLVNAIDINTQNGVRDKCMILLAAQTGLRSGDIINLRFGEILWDKHLIFKTQKKTKLPVSVPLPENLSLLLIDYIKSHRPKSDEPYVFICRDTGNKYSDTMLFAILNKYFVKTDICIGNRKHGPHALRHSLASNLLKGNTPMPVITGILGHKDINTTSKYLSIDIESLRRCCLEVPNEK